MRSTALYAGLNTHGEFSESFIAYVNRDIAPKSVFAFHSVLHIISLSVGDCLKYLPPFWLMHIRLIYTYFARSAKRKFHLQKCYNNAMASLDDLVQQFGNIYDCHSWKLTYTKMYCSSRWTGIHTSCKAALSAWPGLVSLKNDLIVNGYGGKLVEDMDDVEEEDSDCSIDSDVSWEEVLNSDNTRTGNPNAVKAKTDPLLEKERGITDTNWGLNSLMICILDPVTSCMIKLQTTGQPIQHRIARLLSKMNRVLNRSFLSDNNESPEYPQVYEEWRKAMKDPSINKALLVNYMDKIAHNVAKQLLKSLQVRLKPYMSFYLAMELIDPTAPATDHSADTWSAVKDICIKYELEYTMVRKEIIEMRDDVIDLNNADISNCKKKLLGYYKNNLLTLPKNARRKHLECYAQVVFQMPFETVLIESLFSIMNYNKDKKRANLNDKTVASVIHIRDIPSILEGSFSDFKSENLSLDMTRATKHELNW